MTQIDDMPGPTDPYAPPPLAWRLGIAFCAAVLIAFFTYAFLKHHKFFQNICREGGIVENGQFLAFLATSGIAGWVAFRSLHQRDYAVALPYTVFAMGCFVIAGEEICWGQRILDYVLPERLLAINAQNEATFHNIKSIQKKLFHIYALVAGYGCLSSIALLVPALRKHRLVRYYAAHPVCFAYFFPALAYGCIRIAYGPYWRRLQRNFGQQLAKQASILQEPVELGIALGFILIAVVALLNKKAERRDQVDQ